MTIQTNVKKELMAAAYAGVTYWVSQHTANPAGVSGANEVGTRVAVGTWVAGGSDGIYTTPTITISVPAGNSITYIGLNTASSGGVLHDAGALSTPIPSQGSTRNEDIVGTFTIS